MTNRSTYKSREIRYRRMTRRRLRRTVERLDTRPSIEACGDLASRVFSGFERIQEFLGPYCRPAYWAVNADCDCSPDTFNDWSMYPDQESKDELERWVHLGGLVEMVRARSDEDLVVVRLINIERRISCYGVSYPRDKGRRFCIVDNNTTKSSKILKQIFKEDQMALSRWDEDHFELFFLNAPVLIVKPQYRNSVAYGPLNRENWSFF